MISTTYAVNDLVIFTPEARKLLFAIPGKSTDAFKIASIDTHLANILYLDVDHPKGIRFCCSSEFVTRA